jgi:hypothetical protein
MQVATKLAEYGLSGVAVWAIAGFLLFVLGGMAMLFVGLSIGEAVLASMGIESHAGTQGLSIRNSFHPIAWGAFVLAAAAPLGFRLVPGLRFRATGWMVVVLGLLLATVTTYLGIESVRARVGIFDPEYQGFSFFAGPALVAIALAGWAALAVPGRRGTPLGVTALIAVAGLAVALLPSVGSAADGIDSTNLPLASVYIADAVFGALVSFLVVRALFRPGPA